MKKGVAPLNPSTEVGQFRLMVGDTEFTELDPPVEGFGDYTLFSDDEILAALIRADENENRAAGYLYASLASQAAIQSKSVKDYDLQIDLTKRSGDLRAIAKMWFDQADEEDALDGSGDVFEFTAVGSRDHRNRPEAMLGRLYGYLR